MTIYVCIAGATGWVGRSLVPAVCAEPDLHLVGAVSRTHAGKKLGEVIQQTSLDLTISGAVKHEAGSTAEPYVKGTLFAIRQVISFVGLKRGLDSVMEL